MYAGSSGLPYQKNEDSATKAPSATPTNASAAATALAPPTSPQKPPQSASTKSLTPTADIDHERAAMALDSTDIELPPSALVQKVRDVDGVQLMAKRHSIDIEPVAPAGAESRRMSSESPGKALAYDVDPQHYRQLVKGLIPLRSSLMRANIELSSTDVHRKSVHFSDEEGYQLSAIRSYDLEKAVRITCDRQALKDNELESVQLRKHCISKATPTSRQSIWHTISIFYFFVGK